MSWTCAGRSATQVVSLAHKGTGALRAEIIDNAEELQFDLLAVGAPRPSNRGAGFRGFESDGIDSGRHETFVPELESLDETVTFEGGRQTLRASFR